MNLKQQRKQFVQQGLRKLSLRWPEREKVKKKARVRRGFYLCTGYPPQTPHECTSKDFDIDHIKSIGRFTTWDAYVNKLFCSERNLQLLCKTCHKKKTKESG